MKYIVVVRDGGVLRPEQFVHNSFEDAEAWRSLCKGPGLLPEIWTAEKMPDREWYERKFGKPPSDGLFGK